MGWGGEEEPGVYLAGILSGHHGAWYLTAYAELGAQGEAGGATADLQLLGAVVGARRLGGGWLFVTELGAGGIPEKDFLRSRAFAALELAVSSSLTLDAGVGYSAGDGGDDLLFTVGLAWLLGG